jgi:hypothetical protein
VTLLAVAAPPAHPADGEVRCATHAPRDTFGARLWWTTGMGR